MKALAPARVREVRIHEDTGTAEVIVPDFQLSLAIGKEGQNARLAARLSGWRVDIKSETPAPRRGVGRRGRLRRGRVGQERERRAGVPARRGRRGDLRGRGWLRGGRGGGGGRRAGRRADRRGAAPTSPRPRRPRCRRPPPTETADPEASRNPRSRARAGRSHSRRRPAAGEGNAHAPAHLRRVPADGGGDRAGAGVPDARRAPRPRAGPRTRCMVVRAAPLVECLATAHPAGGARASAARSHRTRRTGRSARETRRHERLNTAAETAGAECPLTGRSA